MAAHRDTPARIRAEAAEWMVRLAADPAQEQGAAFRDWLARDPAHAAAFADARLGWQIAAEVGAQVRIPPAPQRRRFRLPLAAGMGLAAAVLAGLWLTMARPDLRDRMLADHAAPPGPAQALTLPDGTQAVLDGGSALDYAQDAEGRRVTLRGGAAYFEVKKDGRSFTVISGGTQVRALGTRFEVRDCGNCTLVTLAEGRVEVDGAGRRTVLEPGQQLRLAAGAPAAPVPVDADEALAWREGRFVFYDASLREVAAMLERHGAGRILFADAALAARPVSGSIRLTDAGAELQSLAEAMGFRIIPLPGGKLLL